jgi:hypothetical protein
MSRESIKNLVLGLAVVAMMGFGTLTAKADPIVTGHLLSNGPINTQGTGFGTLLEVLVLHAKGSTTTEAGGVAWDGSKDIAADEGTAGDVVLNGNSHSSTYSIQFLIDNGFTANNLSIVYNVNEEGVDPNTHLNDVNLRIYSAAGVLLFETDICGTADPTLPCPGDFAAFDQGQGSDGYLFILDPAAAAQVAKYFGPGPDQCLDCRVGLFADINEVGDGAENFYLHANEGPSEVPEPTSMLLLGSGLVGLAAGVRRKFKK